MDKWVTVKDMLNYALENDLKLLSNYTGTVDFWEFYRNNHERLDKLFTTLYKDFRYYDQDLDSIEETVGTVTNRFIDAVFSWLMVNQKKYEELKRINDISFNDKLLEDVDYTRQDVGTTRLGERNDSNTTTSGARTDTLEEQVSPYEASGFQNASKNTTNKGQEQDTENYSKGAETDTSNSTTTVHGKMGGLTKDQVIDKHLNTWENYKYYLAIFNDIAKAYLLV